MCGAATGVVVVAPAFSSQPPSACSSLGSAAVTMPILPIWPFSLEMVPSAAIVTLGVGGGELELLAGGVEQRVALLVHHRAVGAEDEMAGAGQPRAAPGRAR